MKVAGILVALFGIAACSPSVPRNPKEVRALEDTIKEIILEAAQSLPDPLDVQDQTVQLPENSVINGQLIIEQLNIQGLSTLQVTNIQFHILSRTLDLSLLYDDLTGSGSFQNSLEIVSSGQTIDDNPNGNVNLRGVALDLSVQISLSSPIQVQKLTLKPGLSSATVELHGINNDEDLSQQITDEINQNASAWINENSDNIDAVLSPVLIEIINKILAGTNKFEQVAQLLHG